MSLSHTQNNMVDKKILSIGLVCLDIINVVDKYPEEDTDSRFGQQNNDRNSCFSVWFSIHDRQSLDCMRNDWPRDSDFGDLVWYRKKRFILLLFILLFCKGYDVHGLPFVKATAQDLYCLLFCSCALSSTDHRYLWYWPYVYRNCVSKLFTYRILWL